VNEDALRRLLDAAATPAWDDEVRATSAVYRGRLLRSRRRTLAAAATALTLVVAGGALVQLTLRLQPDTSVVLGCASGVGTQGTGRVTATAVGVTLSVNNPTSEVLPVSAGSATVFAVPGASQVTLPLDAGHATVRCGEGKAVALTVERLTASHCVNVSSALDTLVERGRLVDLTRAHVGTLPVNAVVAAVGSASAVRHVQVRSGGDVVAEAVWHEMPGQDDWHLESLARCG
jgi:hypothetical protein